MAHFRATVQGGRGSASRLGHKTSGIEARVNGWNSGVYVYGYHKDGKDYFRVELNGGSGYGGGGKIIGTFSEDDLNR